MKELSTVLTKLNPYIKFCVTSVDITQHKSMTESSINILGSITDQVLIIIIILITFIETKVILQFGK